MVHYINKSALVAEIKSRISDIEVTQKAGMIKKRDADKKILLFKSVLSLIDTIEVKEVDLDDEYTKEVYSHLDSIKDIADRMTIRKEWFEHCKKSWYNEGKIAGMAEGLTDDEKYQQGWHDALEKQDRQKPTEWSEEDEKGLGDALWCCKQAASIAKDENDMGNVWYAENWLKSKYPQKQWKPSDEQLDALLYIVKNYTPAATEKLAWDSLQTLELMLEQLKKL